MKNPEDDWKSAGIYSDGNTCKSRYPILREYSILNFLYCLLLERMFQGLFEIFPSIWENLSKMALNMGGFCSFWRFFHPYFGYFEGAETFFLKDVVESNGVVRNLNFLIILIYNTWHDFTMDCAL